MVAFVANCIWLSITWLVVFHAAFHACNKGFKLKSSSITLFALINFGVTFQMIIFIFLFLLLIVITCLAAPKVPWLPWWRLFHTRVVIIIFTKVALNDGSVATPTFTLFANLYLLPGFNKFLLVSILQFSLDFVNKSVDIFNELLWRHIREIILQHTDVWVQVDQEGFWLRNWMILRVYDDYFWLFWLFSHFIL